MDKPNDIGKAFVSLVELMAKLRGPDGCPWDMKQTPESLKPFLVEECYEVLEALDDTSPDKLKEELGDLLFQIVFHSRIAEEKNEFNIYDVLTFSIAKMTRRHPHVFGDMKLGTDREVLSHWEELKKAEKGYRERTSILDGVPKELPSLLRAQRLQERAARVGFDWNNLGEVLPKLDEELREFREAMETAELEAIEEELGDLFFVLVNISRFIGVNPEEALRKAISRFIRRFKYIEEKASKEGRRLNEMTIDEMDRMWEESKQMEHKS